MKKRLTMGVAIIALSAFLIAGATIAWFTADDTFSGAVFTAGTVEVDADYDDAFKDILVTNWNPGDCSMAYLGIKNTGSKNAVVRLTHGVGEWGDIDEGTGDFTVDGTLAVGNVTIGYYDEIVMDGAVTVYDPADWALHTFGGTDWLYYVGTPLAENDTITVYFTVCLDGPTTDNDYQGKSFKFAGTVGAIQSSNNAPNLDPSWGPIDIGGGVLLYDYLLAP